jgi:hypothetical protein
MLSLASSTLLGSNTGWDEKLTPPEDEGLKVDFIIEKPFDLSVLSMHINDLTNIK